MKRIAYGKIGRVIEIDPDKWGESGGDNEPPALLMNLAKKHTDVEWVVVGRNSGWKPPLPNIRNMWHEGWVDDLRMKAKTPMNDRIRRYDEVTMPIFDEIDGAVVWLGQHGTSNSPLPKVESRSKVTKPQDSFVLYASFILRGINRWRRDDPLSREEVWLLPDVRNYLKGRDLKWPRQHPVLCQFDWERQEWNERYEDPRSPEECGFTGVTVQEGKWRSTDRYVASGLELVGIPEPEPLSNLPPWEERSRFGILINEARAYGMRDELTRGHAMEHYVLPLEPSWVHGTWSAKTLEKLQTEITPIEYDAIFDLMASTRSTFTTPSSGSGWATAKPWESFAAGTVCFFHPEYDTQGHIIPTENNMDDPRWSDEERHLARWLRVDSPTQLRKRVDAVDSSRESYEWIRDAQYRLLRKELDAQRCVGLIESRLGL